MLVVFDLDGTVVDSTGALLEAHEVAWTSLGLQRPPDEAILDLIGLPLIQTMQTLAPSQDAEVLADAYSQAYVKAAAHHEHHRIGGVLCDVTRFVRASFGCTVVDAACSDASTYDTVLMEWRACA